MVKKHVKEGDRTYEVEICEKCSKIKKQKNYGQVNPQGTVEGEFYIRFETAKKGWDICECED